MAKKGELKDDGTLDEENQIEDGENETDDESIEEEKDKKKSASGSKKKQINIMDSKNSNEPPKKSKEEAGPLDMTPVMEAIDKKFTELAESIKPKIDTPKKDSKSKKEDDELGFLAPFGNW